MKDFEFEWKKLKPKRILAMILICCMVMTSMDDITFAADQSGSSQVTPDTSPDTSPDTLPVATPDTTPDTTEVTTPDVTPITTPDVTPDYLDEDADMFGAYALSDSTIRRKLGDSAELKVYAYTHTGNNIVYQWYDENSNAIDDTEDTLTINPLKSGDFGEYRCQVTCEAQGGTYCSNVYFSIYRIYGIQATRLKGMNQQVCYVGETVDFALEAASDSNLPLSYQWYKVGDEDMSGYLDDNDSAWESCLKDDLKMDEETTSSLQTVYDDKNIACYVCEISDGKENCYYAFYVYVNNTTLTVDQHPYYYYVKSGEDLTLSLNATTDNPYRGVTYQWYLQEDDGNQILDGQTGSTLTLTNCTEEKNYICIISDGFASREAYLSVQITDSYLNLYATNYYVQAYEGKSATLSVSPEIRNDSSAEDVSYQWQKEGQDGAGNTVWNDIEGATQSSYTIDTVSSDSYGAYKCVAKLGNDSAEAQLNLMEEQYVYTGQNYFTTLPGYNVDLEVKTADDAPDDITFTWEKGIYDAEGVIQWTPVEEFEGRPHCTAVTEDTDFQYQTVVQYRCTAVSGSLGTSESLSYTLAEYMGTLGMASLSREFTTGSLNYYFYGTEATAYVNQSDYTLKSNVIASDSTPVSNQWYKVDSDTFNSIGSSLCSEEVPLLSEEDAIGGATTEELAFDSVQEGDFGYYICVTSDAAGDTAYYLMQFSQLATLDNQDDEIYFYYNAYIDDTVNLETHVTTSIAEAPQYSWYKQGYDEAGNPVDGDVLGTDAGYQVQINGEEDYGAYVCTVTDGNQTMKLYYYISPYNVNLLRYSEKVKVSEGQTDAVLQCKATTYDMSKMTYKWYKVDKSGQWRFLEVPASTSDTLPLDKVTVDTLGTYICVVSAGTNSEQETFEVTGDFGRLQAYVYGTDAEYGYHQCAIGDTTVLKVSAHNAAGTVSYHWQSRLGYMVGATSVWKDMDETSDTITVGCESYSDFGWYRCIVSDGTYEKTVMFFQYYNSGLHAYVSDMAQSTEKSVTLQDGESTSLGTAAYSSCGDLTYTWEKYVDGQAEVLAGQTDSSYTVDWTQPGKYVCTVSDGKDTAEVTFDVSSVSDFSIYAKDGDNVQYACTGQTNVSFTTGITNLSDPSKVYTAAEYSCKWYYMSNSLQIQALGTQPIDGAESLTYTIPAVKESSFGYYRCDVTINGITESCVFLLIEKNNLTAYAENSHPDAVIGNALTLRVIDAATTNAGKTASDITYNWYKISVTDQGNKQALNGNTASYTFAQLDWSDSGTYCCTVSDGIDSLDVYFYVYMDSELKFSYNNTQQTAENGDTVILRCNATGKAPLYYQWYQMNWDDAETTYKVTPISGAESAVYVIPDVDLSNGSATYQCALTDTGTGITYYIPYSISTNTDDLTVTLNKGSDYEQSASDDGTTLDTDRQVTAGEDVTLNVDVDSAEPYTAQWYYQSDMGSQYYDSLETSGISYTIPAIQADQYGNYLCRISTAYITIFVQYVVSGASKTVSDVDACSLSDSDGNTNRAVKYYNDTYKDAKALKVTFADDVVMDNGTLQVSANGYDFDQTFAAASDVAGKTITVPGNSVLLSYNFMDGNYNIAVKDIQPVYGVDSIEMEQQNAAMDVGDSLQLKADITAKEQADHTILWSSSDSNVATVDADGKVTGVAEGTATIYAVTGDEEKLTACEVDVSAVDVTGLTLNKYSMSLLTGSSETLTAEIAPSNATNKSVKWSSSNPSVATVSNGKVQAVAAGTTAIKATTVDGNISVSCTITVTDPVIKVTGVSLSQQSLTIVNGKTAQLGASVYPKNATTKSVAWSSSNTKAATVSNDGKVTAKANGSAVITVTTADGNKSASCKVTVITPSTKVVTTASAYMAKGKTLTLSATMTPSDTTDQITWSSSKTSVATVNSKGRVTAKGIGTVTITAKASSGKKATCKITVIKAKVSATAISLNKSKASIKAGSTVTLKATMSPKKTTDSVSWSTSNKKVATVDKNGIVTGIKGGTVTITAKTISGKKAVCKISVKVPATSVSLSRKTAAVRVSKTIILKATMNPKGSTDTVTWSSSNKKCATVKDGKVKALKKGTVTITVRTSSGKKATCKITVK